MKKLLTFLLVLSGAIAQAQTYTLVAGINSFSINGESHLRNTMGVKIPTYDTTKAMIFGTNRIVVPLTSVSNYLRSDGTPFENAYALVGFYDSFMVSASGGGGSTNPVIVDGDTILYSSGGVTTVGKGATNTVYDNNNGKITTSSRDSIILNATNGVWMTNGYGYHAKDVANTQFIDLLPAVVDVSDSFGNYAVLQDYGYPLAELGIHKTNGDYIYGDIELDTSNGNNTTEKVGLMFNDNHIVTTLDSQYGHWIKAATIRYIDFATAATYTVIPTGYSLPAYGLISNATIVVDTAFSGGSLSNYQISVGSSAVGDDGYFTINSVFTGYTLPFVNNPVNLGNGIENVGLGSTITITATSTDDNLDAATQGQVSIYLFISILPH